MIRKGLISFLDRLVSVHIYINILLERRLKTVFHLSRSDTHRLSTYRKSTWNFITLGISFLALHYPCSSISTIPFTTFNLHHLSKRYLVTVLYHSRIFFFSFFLFLPIHSYSTLALRFSPQFKNEGTLGTRARENGRTVTWIDTAQPFVSIECVNLRADETTELRKKRGGH